MEEWQELAIKNNLSRLLKVTNCNVDLLTQMHHYLSDEDRMELDGIPSQYTKRNKFYEILMTKDGAFEPLIKGLHAAKQTGAAVVLEKEKKAWEQANPNQANVVESPLSPSEQKGGTSSLPNRGSVERVTKTDATPPGVDKVDFVVNTNALRVDVRRPARKIEFVDDHYKIHGDEKGHAIVINITEFVNSSYNRGGAQYDTEYMCELWKQLGYTVEVHEGTITKENLDDILEKFKENFTLRNGSSCVVFIGSHGRFSEIETSDHQPINLYRNIVYKFDARRCPQLKGKPKLFLIQACQGFRTETDSIPNRNEADRMLEAPIDDTMVCFSTTPGFLSNRDKYLGTWFTYCLTKVFMEEAYQLSFYDLLKKTQETMRNIDGEPGRGEPGQLCVPVDLGLRKFYFNLNP